MGLAGLILVWGLLFYLVRPLLPSSDYAVTAVFQGRPIQAKLLKPLCISGLYYVHLTDDETLRSGYRLIGFDPNKKLFFSPNQYVGPLGIFYVHTDQLGGMDVTDLKKQSAQMATEFSSTGARCFNDTLSVSLTHRRVP